MNRLERVQRKATEDYKRPGSVPEYETVRELGLFSLEKRLQGSYISMFLYLRDSYSEDGDSLFKWRFPFEPEEIFDGHRMKIFHSRNNQPLE